MCSPQSCPETYYWDTASCSCRCKHQDCAPTEYFDYGRCGCFCKPVDCNAPGIGNYEMPIEEWFDYSDCSCKCKYPAGPPNNNYDIWVFNLATCSWDCKPQSCAEGQYFDTILCQCACLDDDCPTGYIWNPTGCDCECVDASVTCTAQEQWDFLTCSCIPCREPLAGCASNEYWN